MPGDVEVGSHSASEFGGLYRTDSIVPTKVTFKKAIQSGMLEKRNGRTPLALAERLHCIECSFFGHTVKNAKQSITDSWKS